LAVSISVAATVNPVKWSVQHLQQSVGDLPQVSNGVNKQTVLENRI